MNSRPPPDRRPVGRRPVGLTLELVIEAAKRVVRRHGVDGVTMRAVAAELDVTPMALYHYVDNKDALIALVAANVAAATDELSDRNGWAEGLREHLLQRWEVFKPYPGLGNYMINLPMLGMTAERYRMGKAFFVAAGFPPDEAGKAWAYALTYLHGRLSVDARIDRAAARAAGVAEARAADHVTFGVDMIVRGLQSLLDDLTAASPVGDGRMP